MVALIDHKGRADIRQIDFVGAKQIEDFDRARAAGFHDAGDIAAARPGHETEIETADPRRRAVQHVEAVPVRTHHAECLGDCSPGAQNASAVGACERTLPQDDHRRLGSAQHLGRGSFATDQRIQRLAAVAEPFDREGQIGRRADRRDPEAAAQIALSQPRIDERRFPARIGADEQTGVGLLDAGDRRVEQIAGAAPRIEPGAVLAAIETRRAEPGQQFFQRVHRLGIAKIAGDRGDPLARHTLQPIGDEIEGLLPFRFDQLAIASDVGPVEPAPYQAVDREAGLVRDPLLVDVLMQARQHAQDLRAA